MTEFCICFIVELPSDVRALDFDFLQAVRKCKTTLGAEHITCYIAVEQSTTDWEVYILI
jgi:hypothetical protein